MRAVLIPTTLAVLSFGQPVPASPKGFQETSLLAGSLSETAMVVPSGSNMTGNFASDHRSFYVFDIPQFSRPVAQARLVFDAGRGFKRFGDDATRTIGIWNFSGDADLLVPGQPCVPSCAAVFDDLGTGTLLSTQTIVIPGPAAPMPEVVFDLDATARGLIADVGNAGGGRFAVGAEIDASNTLQPLEGIWTNSSGNDAARLVVTLVPESDGT